MRHIFTLFIFLTVINSSCSLQDPISRAHNESQKGKHQEALKILEKEYKAKPNSIPVKSLLAQAYSDYGLALCQDQNKPPKEKYGLAKEQFAMALALNPYLKDAKDMYEMIEKIQDSFKENNLN